MSGIANPFNVLFRATIFLNMPFYVLALPMPVNIRYFIFAFCFIFTLNDTFAQSFVNGDLEGDVEPFESNVLPDFWLAVPFTDPACVSPDWVGATPDLCNSIAPLPLSGFAGYAQSGDHFLSGLHVLPSAYHEGIMQEVSGFTVGAYYAVNFYQSPLVSFTAEDTIGSWAVYRDFDEIGISEPSSTPFSLADLGMNWQYRSIIFEATAPTHTIKFLPQSDGLGDCEGEIDNGPCHLLMGIDNVALTLINPEPDFGFENVCVGEEMDFENLTGSTEYIDFWHWDFGDGNTSDLESPSHFYEFPGTYEVKLVAGYFDSITYTVTVFPPPLVDFEYIQETNYLAESGTKYCTDNLFTFTDLTVTELPDFASEWLWTFGDGEGATIQHPEHVYEDEGTFEVNLEVVTNEGCRMDTSKNVIVQKELAPIAQFDFGIGEDYYVGTPVHFYNQSINATGWQWNFGDGTEVGYQHPEHAYEHLGNYTITLIAENAFCTDTTFKIIRINEALLFYIPNAFTPNGDGFNNSFKPVFTSGFDPYDYHLTLFNRWGEIVFESYNASVGWDGTYNNHIAEDGVYSWSIEFGSINSDEKIKTRGHFTLLK